MNLTDERNEQDLNLDQAEEDPSGNRPPDTSDKERGIGTHKALNRKGTVSVRFSTDDTRAVSVVPADYPPASPDTTL
jgi:hypothetical protein